MNGINSDADGLERYRTRAYPLCCLWTHKFTKLFLLICVLATSSCQRQAPAISRGPAVPPHPTVKPLPDNASPQLKQMLDGAIAQAGVTTGYDPSYVALEYPGGDVPEKTGVCSDVVVRAFRKAGIDLQKEVHEDMKVARGEYPTKWGAIAPDRNIDHRRVLNLMAYFTRRGKSLPISSSAAGRPKCPRRGFCRSVFYLDQVGPT